jgi:phosphomannomutase/phosphoglucomutase
MNNANLVFTPSGIRGKIEKDLTPQIVKKIVIAFSTQFKNNEKRIIIGRDTRPTSKRFEKEVIEGLLDHGFEIISTGICPTPVVIHAKNRLNIPGGIIITGSHNSEEWNGLKLISSNNYLDASQMNQIKNKLSTINLKSFPIKKMKNHEPIKNLNPLEHYIQDLLKHINLESIVTRNNLSVVIDPGAGTGKFVTPQILRKMGCEVKLINVDLLANQKFPRGIDPIETNLRDLIMEVWRGKYDIGFAHDSDTDRLAIIGDDGRYYSGDVSLSLIVEDYLKNNYNSTNEIVIITNLASSLRFEILAERYDAKVIRTPIGERNLATKINSLINEKGKDPETFLVFGGEGSGGGLIYPYFNLTRDGIFTAAKITEILVKNERKVSDLVSQLPKYYSHRKKIELNKVSLDSLIRIIKKELIDEGEEVLQSNLDLRFGKDKEWFILIHPSNTEPVIRVISEAKRESLARIYCEATAELVKLIISRM